MRELDEDFDRFDDAVDDDRRRAEQSRRGTLRLVVLAVAGAVVVGLMIALVGPALGG